jgi:hypothetical protein
LSPSAGWVTAPPRENVIVKRAPSDEARLEHVEAAFKEACLSARRQLMVLQRQAERQ